MPAHIYTTGRRTTLRADKAAEYERIHAVIPDLVETVLRGSGVLRWHIWRDGQLLFHVIESTEPYDATVRAIEQLGPIDRAWDSLIASLLESEASTDQLLPLVWSMNSHQQNPAPGTSSR